MSPDCKVTHRYTSIPTQQERSASSGSINGISSIQTIYENAHLEKYKKESTPCETAIHSAQFIGAGGKGLLDGSNLLAYAFTLGLTGLGAMLGAFVGIPAGPVGIAGGAVGGGVLGASIPLGISIGLVRHDFIKWKRDARHQAFVDELLRIEQRHSLLQPFRCAYSGDIIIDPVISPFNITYDREAIERYLKSNNQEPPHLHLPSQPPRPITKDQLKPNNLVLAAMNKAYKQIVDDNLQRPDIPQEIKEGFMAISRDLQRRLNEARAEASKDNEMNLNNGTITADQYRHNLVLLGQLA